MTTKNAPLVAGVITGLVLSALTWLARMFVVPFVDLFTCRPEGWSFPLAWFGAPLLVLALFLAVRVAAPFRRGLVVGGLIPISIILILTHIGSYTCP